MSIFLTQNPGIGGLDELTNAEEAFLTSLAGLPYVTGDILYYDGTNLMRLAKGADGQVLSLASGIPAWADSGGDMAIPYETRIQLDSGDGNISYVGKSATGSITSTSTWQIQRIDETVGFILEWADGDANFDNIWDNREALSYS